MINPVVTRSGNTPVVTPPPISRGSIALDPVVSQSSGDITVELPPPPAGR